MSPASLVSGVFAEGNDYGLKYLEKGGPLPGAGQIAEWERMFEVFRRTDGIDLLCTVPAFTDPSVTCYLEFNGSFDIYNSFPFSVQHKGDRLR
jgi:hypothetical protein